MSLHIAISGDGDKYIADIIKNFLEGNNLAKCVGVVESSPGAPSPNTSEFVSRCESEDSGCKGSCSCSCDCVECETDEDTMYVYRLTEEGLVVNECFIEVDPDRGTPYITDLFDVFSGDSVVDCDCLDLNMYEDMGVVIDNGDDTFLISCCRCDEYAIEQFREYMTECDDDLSSSELVAPMEDIIGG